MQQSNLYMIREWIIMPSSCFVSYAVASESDWADKKVLSTMKETCDSTLLGHESCILVKVPDNQTTE